MTVRFSPKLTGARSGKPKGRLFKGRLFKVGQSHVCRSSGWKINGHRWGSTFITEILIDYKLSQTLIDLCESCFFQGEMTITYISLKIIDGRPRGGGAT